MSREEMIDEAVRRFSRSRDGIGSLELLLRRSPTKRLLVSEIGREFRAVCAEQGVAHE